jgi:thioredoxin-related protein
VVDKEMGILVTLVDRFVMQSLPRALTLRKKVHRGVLLDEMEIITLKNMIQQALDNQHYIDHKPEMHHVFLRATCLYCEIVDRAVFNEQSNMHLQ